MERIVVGISGASGLSYAIRLLEILKPLDFETHLVSTDSSKLVHKHECQGVWQDVLDLADIVHENENVAASIASGSFKAKAMVIIPCSGTTLGKIASGVSDNLLTRSATVMLKERRKLILVPRETPLSVIYIENMLKMAQAGAIMIPAMPAFYNLPKTIDDNVNFIVGRILDVLDIDANIFKRWEGPKD